MKAFLSHSSLDKEFVQEVADKLGRASCIFDKYSFQNGLEFEQSIIKHLGNSSVFVLFATQNSLESLWCEFEVINALDLKINKKIGRAVVYIIGDGVTLDKIPVWLKRALIRTDSSPASIARDIEFHLREATEDFQRPIFLGRSKEREIIEDIINPIDGRKKPKTFALFGLPGIGRRSLIKSCISQLFSLSKTVEIEVEPGDNANSLCIKLADKIEPYSCTRELQDIVNIIEKLTEQEAISRSIRNIERLVSSGELLLLVDTGGCCNDNGTLKNHINKLVEESVNSRNAYFIFILTRRISSDNPLEIDCIPVDQLSNKAIGQILTQMGERIGFTATPTQISELVEYINGYPPSALYAAKQASAYGIPALICDKRKLVQFSNKRFVSHIKDQNLNDADKSVLRMLATYSPLPLESILALYNGESSASHDRVYELIDCALVRVLDGQNYYIADPIKGSVRDVLGIPDTMELKCILPTLISYIENVESERKLDFSRILFRINFALGNTNAKEYGIKLRADFIKLLEQAYHQQRYTDAVDLGYEAVKECPEDSSARNFLIKALIQEERWSAAEEQIADLYPTDELRNVYFLTGFMLRKMGKANEAINKYNQSEQNGRKGVSLQRELAHCYIMLNDYDSARTHISKALNIQSDNAHIIDMAAKLEIKIGDEKAALNHLDKLELVDDPKHFNMRASAFHLKFGRPEPALKHSELALEAGGIWFLAGRVQYIKALIALKRFELARTEISKLDVNWRNQKNDVKTALRCGLAAAESDFQTGYKLISQFSVQSSLQAKGYKKKFCSALVKDLSIPYENRLKYQNELDLLSDTNEFDFLDIEP